MIKVSIYLRMIAAFTLIAYFVTNSNFAYAQTSAPSNLSSQIKIPARLGSTEETFTSGSGKTVIYIQDAHDSLEAQKNTAKLIEDLVEHYGIKTVYEEGYEGPVPTDKLFGWIQDLSIKKKISAFLLDKLRIGGAEYAHINRKKDFKLIGADDLNRYKKNIRAFRQASKHNRAIDRDLEAILVEIQSLSNLSFPGAFKEWLKSKDQFEANQIELLEYLKRTMKAAYGPESAVAHHELPSVLLLLTAEASKNLAMLDRAKAVDAKTLFEELLTLENRVAHRLLTNKRDLEIFRYREALRLLKRLNQIEVTPDEYAACRKSLSELNTQELANFIAREGKKSLVLSKAWETRIKTASAFYEIAHQRDGAIEKSLKEFVNLKDEKSAVLVYGGFHKANIRSILRKLGVNYQIIAPKISKMSPVHQSYYKQLMAVGHHNFEKSFLSSGARATRPPSLLLNEMLAASEIRSLQSALTRNPALSTGLLERAVSIQPRLVQAGARSEARSEFDDNEMPPLEATVAEQLMALVRKLGDNGWLLFFYTPADGIHVEFNKSETPDRVRIAESIEASLNALAAAEPPPTARVLFFGQLGIRIMDQNAVGTRQMTASPDQGYPGGFYPRFAQDPPAWWTTDSGRQRYTVWHEVFPREEDGFIADDDVFETVQDAIHQFFTLPPKHRSETRTNRFVDFKKDQPFKIRFTHDETGEPIEVQYLGAVEFQDPNFLNGRKVTAGIVAISVASEKVSKVWEHDPKLFQPATIETLHKKAEAEAREVMGKLPEGWSVHAVPESQELGILGDEHYQIIEFQSVKGHELKAEVFEKPMSSGRSEARTPSGDEDRAQIRERINSTADQIQPAVPLDTASVSRLIDAFKVSASRIPFDDSILDAMEEYAGEAKTISAPLNTARNLTAVSIPLRHDGNKFMVIFKGTDPKNSAEEIMGYGMYSLNKPDAFKDEKSALVSFHIFDAYRRKESAPVLFKSSEIMTVFLAWIMREHHPFEFRVDTESQILFSRVGDRVKNSAFYLRSGFYPPAAKELADQFLETKPVLTLPDTQKLNRSPYWILPMIYEANREARSEARTPGNLGKPLNVARRSIIDLSQRQKLSFRSRSEIRAARTSLEKLLHDLARKASAYSRAKAADKVTLGKRISKLLSAPQSGISKARKPPSVNELYEIWNQVKKDVINDFKSSVKYPGSFATKVQSQQVYFFTPSDFKIIAIRLMANYSPELAALVHDSAPNIVIANIDIVSQNRETAYELLYHELLEGIKSPDYFQLGRSHLFKEGLIQFLTKIAMTYRKYGYVAMDPGYEFMSAVIHVLVNRGVRVIDLRKALLDYRVSGRALKSNVDALYSQSLQDPKNILEKIGQWANHQRFVSIANLLAPKTPHSRSEIRAWLSESLKIAAVFSAGYFAGLFILHFGAMVSLVPAIISAILYLGFKAVFQPFPIEAQFKNIESLIRTSYFFDDLPISKKNIPPSKKIYRNDIEYLDMAQTALTRINDAGLSPEQILRKRELAEQIDLARKDARARHLTTQEQQARRVEVTTFKNPNAWRVIGGNHNIGFVLSALNAETSGKSKALAWFDFHRMVFDFPKFYEIAAAKKLPLVLVVPEKLDGLTPLDPLSPWIEGARTTLAWASAYARFENLGGLDLRILKVPEASINNTEKIRAAAAYVMSLPANDVSLTPEDKVTSQIYSFDSIPLMDSSKAVFESVRPPAVKEPAEEIFSPPTLLDKQKRVVISGGAGFLGSHITKRLLDKGYQVVVIDNLLSGNAENLTPLKNHPSGLVYYQSDISKHFKVEGPVDFVLHFASLATPGDYYNLPRETLLSGLEGTKNMLELAREKNARFLTSSTSEVYGQPLVHPQTETYPGNVNPIGKRSQYDQSKRGGETLVKLYYEKYGLDVRISRIFNTYGPGMRFGAIHDTRLIPNFIKAVLNGQPMEMFGGGGQTRSFAFVDDTVNGLLALLETDKIKPNDSIQDRVFNIGNPHEFTVKELAEKLTVMAKELFGIDASFISVSNPDKDDPLKRKPDISKAQTVLGFSPEVSLEEGLRKTFLDFHNRHARSEIRKQNRAKPEQSLNRLVPAKTANRGTLFISTDDITALTQDQQDELFKTAWTSKNELRFVVYGNESSALEKRAVRAFLKIPNVKRANTENISEASKRYSIPGSTQIVLNNNISTQDIPKNLKRVLIKELGAIAFAKLYAMNGGAWAGVIEKDGVIDPSKELLAGIIEKQLAHLVVAYAA